MLSLLFSVLFLSFLLFSFLFFPVMQVHEHHLER